ncbi:ferredoxin [Geodermatophilus sp. DF01-2]|uniref:ferredoxin n=1 Tax=Geodermatophilus sp. DF01-2 TaxID=2559610 RepID=UPI001073BF02|nr:ferredoxin [Geodermatophilus sp. DF01_2]TFV63688.1 ferredoxin [Geodermatophilus sp. DF01_2]
MRVEVDRERCVGSGTCELLAPDVFEVGDDGVVRVLGTQPGPADEDAVRDAVAQCPTGALGLPG